MLNDPLSVDRLLVLLPVIFRINLVVEDFEKKETIKYYAVDYKANNEANNEENKNYKYEVKDGLDCHYDSIYLMKLKNDWYVLIKEHCNKIALSALPREIQEGKFNCAMPRCRRSPDDPLKGPLIYKKKVRTLAECSTQHRFHRECLQEHIEGQSKKISEQTLLTVSCGKDCNRILECPICKKDILVEDIKRIFGIYKYLECKRAMVESIVEDALTEKRKSEERRIKEKFKKSEVLTLECCKKAVGDNPQKPKLEELDKEVLQVYVLHYIKRLPDAKLIEYSIPCPLCYNSITEGDLKIIFPKEEDLREYSNRACARCRNIFDLEDNPKARKLAINQIEYVKSINSGYYQVLPCKESHKICSVCLHFLISRAKPSKQPLFKYPIYACPTCNKDIKEEEKHIKTELRSIHCHDKHSIDLNYLVYQFTQYPPNAPNAPIPCLDSTCTKHNHLYDRHINNLMNGYISTYENIIYDEGAFANITPNMIKELNIWLYRYYIEILALKKEGFVIRGYVYFLEEILRRPDRTNNEKDWMLLNKILDSYKVDKYPDDWDRKKNLEEEVTLRVMAEGEKSYKEALDMLKKSIANPRVSKALMIQNPKHWQLYDHTKEIFKNDIWLAIVLSEEQEKSLNSNKFILGLIGTPGIKGRAVYLTIQEDVKKLAKANEQGEYTVVYTKVLLGDPDPNTNAKIGYKDPNNFIKYGHKKYTENNCTMYAIYNLGQIYPLYAITYKP